MTDFDVIETVEFPRYKIIIVQYNPDDIVNTSVPFIVIVAQYFIFFSPEIHSRAF